MHRPIRLADNTLDQSELETLCEWILSGARLTKDALTVQFESALADYLGTRHAVFVNSGSSANLLMIYALIESGALRNNIVVAPAVSWVTTVSPLIQLGLDVQLCDCDENDLGLDVQHFERLCAEHRPSLAILVHVLGHANQMDAVRDICSTYDVHLLEDSCEALGSAFNGTSLGGLGLAGSFSFYYGHHISTIEGGAVVTNDRDLYNLMLSVRSHGWGRDVEREYHDAWAAETEVDEVRDLYTFYHAGFNLRSTDLNAHLGLSQLTKLDRLVAHRESVYDHYSQRLGRYWRQVSETRPLSSFAYGTLVSNRLETFRHLKSQGIETRPLICGNLGRHPFWSKRFGETRLPMADRIHDHGLYLPNHLGISPADVDFICDKFEGVAKPA